MASILQISIVDSLLIIISYYNNFRKYFLFLLHIMPQSFYGNILYHWKDSKMFKIHRMHISITWPFSWKSCCLLLNHGNHFVVSFFGFLNLLSKIFLFHIIFSYQLSRVLYLRVDVPHSMCKSCFRLLSCLVNEDSADLFVYFGV